MKKFIIIIVILAIIFIGMVIHKNLAIETTNVTIEEVSKIENYINQIYLQKEIVGESLPYFENINDANEKWIWEVVKKNTEEDKISYEQLQEKAKEIFGQDFTKEFPKEGTDYLKYNEQENLYEIIITESYDQGALFLLNNIEKEKEGYKVELVEYLEDYSPMLSEQPEDYIIIKNLDGEEISKTSSSNEEEELDIVKRNIDRFSKKEVLLKSENEKLYIQKVLKK